MTQEGITELDRSIGRKVRQVRKSKKITLEQMSESLSVTHQALSKREIGEIRIPASSLVEYARVLECSPMDFLP